MIATCEWAEATDHRIIDDPHCERDAPDHDVVKFVVSRPSAYPALRQRCRTAGVAISFYGGERTDGSEFVEVASTSGVEGPGDEFTYVESALGFRVENLRAARRWLGLPRTSASVTGEIALDAEGEFESVRALTVSEPTLAALVEDIFRYPEDGQVASGVAYRFTLHIPAD